MRAAGWILCLWSASAAMACEDPLMRAAGTRAYRPPKDTVEILPKVEIGAVDGRVLNATIFRPRNRPADPLPAIVFIHGGGWRQGSHYNTFSAWMAERGYLVASIDYRLSKEAKWPAQIQDCQRGVRWLRANAGKWGIDPDRIGIWGTSAGGQLAACVAIMPGIPDRSAPGSDDTSSRVQAAAAFCAPTDFTAADWHHPQHVIDLFGVPYADDPARWRQASPALWARPGAPPFLIVHGMDDTAVPFSQAERLKAALEAQGNTVEWLPVKHGQHDFFLHPTTPESVIEPTHEEIMTALLKFFDRHLKNP